MSIISNPDDIIENKRKTIIVLDRKDFDKAMKNYKDGQFLLDDRICYLPKPMASQIEESEILKNLDHNGLLQSGNVLILQSGNNYLPFEKALEETAFSQMNDFNLLCQYLGVKEVSYKIIENQDETNHIDGSISADVKMVGLNTDAQYTVKSQIKQKIKSHTKFAGGMPDIQKANELIHTGTFNNNRTIMNFYQSVCHQANKIQRQTVCFELAKDLTKEFDALINIDASILKQALGEVNLKILKELSYAIKIEYEVIF